MCASLGHQASIVGVNRVEISRVRVESSRVAEKVLVFGNFSKGSSSQARGNICKFRDDSKYV